MFGHQATENNGGKFFTPDVIYAMKQGRVRLLTSRHMHQVLSSLRRAFIPLADTTRHVLMTCSCHG